MKIDKSIWDTFSSMGNKNIQQSSDSVSKPEGTPETSHAAEISAVAVSSSTAESDAAVKLSGADEVEVKSFIQSVNGTPEEKMAIVRMAQNKGIALTRSNLTALHRTMTDSNPAITLEEGLKGLESSTDQSELKQLVSQLQNLLKGSGNMSLQQVSGGMTIINISESGAEAEAQSFLLDRFTAKELLVILAAVVKGNLPADTAQKLLNGSLTTGELSFGDLNLGTKDLQALKTVLIDALVVMESPKWHPKDDKTLTELWVDHDSQPVKSDQAGLTASQVSQENKVHEGHQTIYEDLDVSQEDVFMTDMLQGLEESIAAMVEGIQQSGVGLDQAISSNIRQVLRVEVTERMVEAKTEFKTMKTELTHQLQKLEAPLSLEDQKRVLKSVVEKLDDFIMKSDAMMYTSMKNERDLLKTSSVLQEALKLLVKGKSEEAFALTKRAMTDIDRMIFKPSSKRVEAHLAGKLSDWREGSLDQASNTETQAKSRLQKALGSTYQVMEPGESSGRLLMEMMRKLGLNNEFEHSEEILKSVSKKDHDGQARLDDNVKAMLMKMAEERSEDAHIEPVQRALESLLGTQLMNRHEVGRDEQTVMFVVPWGPQADQSVKVMINGRKNGGVMSWENCSLYFSFNTKRLGQTGIRVTISDKTVSMAVFNDQEESKKVLEGYLDHLYQGFVEVGFQKGNVGYAKFGFTEDKKEAYSEIRQFSEAMKVMSSPQQSGKTMTPAQSAPVTEAPSRGFELKI